MRNFKKMLSFLLSLAMVFAMGVSAVGAAAVTIPTGSTHTFTAYQIFAGTVSTDGKTLSNITWGTDASSKSTDIISKLTGSGGLLENKVTPADTTATAAEIAAAIEKESITGRQLAAALSTIDFGNGTTLNAGSNTLSEGYYLIKDSKDTESAYILEVVGDVTVKPKLGAPTTEKYVKEVDDSAGTTDVKKAADMDIGDKVEFRLVAKLPDNVTSYTAYYLQFTDELTNLTLDKASVKAYVLASTDEEKGDLSAKTAIDSTKYTVSDVADNKFTVTFNNVKDTAVGATDESKIVVVYEATLATTATLGTTGNPNTVYITYSNNPDSTYDGTSTPSGDDTDDTSTAKSTAIVFTYETVINKKDESSNALTGAGFTLYKKYNTAPSGATAYDATNYANYYSYKTEEKGDTMTTFTFSGLDDGDYLLVESTTPNGYNTITPIEFSVTSTIDDTTNTLTSVAGAGINNSTISFTADTDYSTLTADIVNKKGTVLPSTGGMGTRVIYLIGGALVIAASVLLITKRRMGKSE